MLTWKFTLRYQEMVESDKKGLGRPTINMHIFKVNIQALDMTFRFSFRWKIDKDRKKIDSMRIL